MGTALVTGATSGLGLEFAWQLAHAHHDLVLVARNEQRLSQLADELHQIAGVGAQVLPADLSVPEDCARVAQRLRLPGSTSRKGPACGAGTDEKEDAVAQVVPAPGDDPAGGSGAGSGERPCADLAVTAAPAPVGLSRGLAGAETAERSAGGEGEGSEEGPAALTGSRGPAPHTAEQVAARPVDLLVNNAGFGLGQSFVGGDLAREERALDVMVRAVLVLSHAAAGAMTERGRGAILNVSSMTARTAMGTYAAHKAWVLSFTEGLAGELAGTGVTATALCPGLVHTGFHTAAGVDEATWRGPVWLDAERVVADGLAAVRRGQVICTPSLRYRSASALLRGAPRWVVRRVAGTSRSAQPRV